MPEGHWEGRRSPARLVLVTLLSIAAVEVVLMLLVLPRLPDMSPATEAVFDAAFLGAITAPLIYLLLFRPMKRGHRERVAAERRFHHLVESSNDAIVTADGDRRVVGWNDAAEEVFGYPAEEAVGMLTDDLVPEGERVLHAEAYDAFVDEGGELDRTYEMEALRKDGARVPVDLSLSAHREGERCFVTAIARDVSEVREAKERFQSIVETSPDAIFRLDTEGEVTYVSPSAEEITGLPREEIESRHFSDLVPESSLEPAADAFGRLISGEPVRDLGIELLRSDGSPVPVEVNAAPVERGGEVVGVQGMYRDVSRRRESERRFEQLVRDMNDGYVVTDVGGVVTFANQALADILAVDGPEDVVGHSLVEFLAPEERAGAARVLRAAVEDWRLPESDERDVVRPDGSRTRININPELVRERGEVAGIRGVVRDVSERRQEQRKTELLISLLQEVSRAPDLDAALETLVTRFCEEAGWDYGEAWIPGDGALEPSPAYYVSDPEYEAFREAGLEFRRGYGLPGRVWLEREPEWVADVTEEEVGYYPRTDEAAEVGIRTGFGVPIVADDEVVAVLAFWMEEEQVEQGRMVDLVSAVASQLGLATRQKRLEEELRRTKDELEVLNRLVRHDIRNDMQLVTGWGDVLRGHVDEAGEEVLERVLEASQDVIDLTFTARDYISVILGEEGSLAPTDLSAVVRREAGKARGRYGPADIEVDAPPSAEVEADEMLHSVVRNLVNNAVQHSDKDCPHVELAVEECGDEVLLTVADDGPGVPEAERERIFGKGEKGLESGGTGIGLYLVKTLVGRYGGSVEVRGNEPRGAVFEVRLPKARY